MPPMKRSILRFRLSATVLAVTGALLLGCTPEPAATAATSRGSRLAQVKQKGRLTILSIPHQESAFVKTNLASGPMKRVGTAENFEGADVEIMAAFADHLGVELEIRPALGESGLPAYSELIPALLRQEGDLIASSFSITEDRRKKIEFSSPYFTIYPAVVALREGPVKELADLKDKMVSTVPGTSQERHILAAGFTEEQVVYKEFQFENYSAVLDGEVDFTVQDSSSADRVVRTFPELRVVGPLVDVQEHYGYGIPAGSDLAGELNAFLAEIEANGDLERTLNRHLSTGD